MFRRTLRTAAPSLSVITRRPSPAMNDCELVLRDRQSINVDKVISEHDNYVSLFTRDVTIPAASVGFSTDPSTVPPEGLTTKLDTAVIELPALGEYADSVFVEDVCVMLPLHRAAILTRPGVESRRGEVQHIKNAVESVCTKVFSLADYSPDATADGGDILVVNDFKRKKGFIFVGQSSRTNRLGYEAFAKFAAECGGSYTAIPVSVSKNACMHLKCAVTRIDEEGTVLVNPSWVDRTIFTSRGLDVVDIVSPNGEEEEASNVLAFTHKGVGGRAFTTVNSVVVSSRFPKNVAFMKEWAAGKNKEEGKMKNLQKIFWDVQEIDVSEVAKAEGALTCCSLIAPTF